MPRSVNAAPSSLVLSLWAGEIRADASPDQLAASVAIACTGIEAALAPIIGKRGMTALFNRSLHVTGQTYPWLADVIVRNQTAMDVESLRTALACRTSAEASAYGLLLLKTVTDLLASLVGPSLTERLLRSVTTSATKGLRDGGVSS